MYTKYEHSSMLHLYSIFIYKVAASKTTRPFSIDRGRHILIPVLYHLSICKAILKHLEVFYYHSNNIFIKKFFWNRVNFEPLSQLILQNILSYIKQHNSVQHNSVNLLANARHSGSRLYRVIWAVSKVTANQFFDMPCQIL